MGEITQSLLSRNKEKVLHEGSFLKRGDEVQSDSDSVCSGLDQLEFIDKIRQNEIFKILSPQDHAGTIR